MATGNLILHEYLQALCKAWFLRGRVEVRAMNSGKLRPSLNQRCDRALGLLQWKGAEPLSRSRHAAPDI